MGKNELINEARAVLETGGPGAPSQAYKFHLTNLVNALYTAHEEAVDASESAPTGDDVFKTLLLLADEVDVLIKKAEAIQTAARAAK